MSEEKKNEMNDFNEELSEKIIVPLPKDGGREVAAAAAEASLAEDAATDTPETENAPAGKGKNAESTEDETTPEDHGEAKPKTLSDFINAEEEGGRTNISLRTVLGGDIITGRWFRKHLGFILLLSLMAIIYTSNRYAYQFEMIERKELTDTLHDRRYKALTRSSQLHEKMLRSNVERDLLDSTLQTASTPSYVIKPKH